MANNYSQATICPDLPASLFSEKDLDSLSFACGLSSEPSGECLYLYAGDGFCEEAEDENGDIWNCTLLLQGKLKQLDAKDYPSITIEGAMTCDKMRPGEFGGFAYYIARDEIRYVSTWQWLHEQGL